jgi:hypothetical protein
MVANIDQATWLYDKIRSYIPANRVITGNDINFPCPFCNEAVNAKKRGTRRGHYYVNTQTYWCYRCEKWAHGLELYAVLSGQPLDSIKPEYFRFKYSKDSKLILPSEYTKDEYGIEYNEIPTEFRNELTISAKNYLINRRIFKAPGLPKDYKFYYYKDPKHPRDFIVIPWIYNGQECYYQRRILNDKTNSGIKYIFPKDTEKAVFGLDNIDTSFKYIICTEGVFDAIWIKNGVAIGGKALSDYQKWFIAQRYPHHVLAYAFDNDIAGKDAMLKTIEKNPNSKFLNWYGYSKDCKDINEFIIKYNSNIFNNQNNIEKMICSSVQMKLILKYNK